MRGKNAARAAPMLALYPLSRFSAWRMVGARQQHLRGKAGGNFPDRRERFGKGRRLQFGGDRRSDHQIQSVLVLGHQRGVAGDLDPRRIDGRFGLVEIESRGDPRVEATEREPVRFLIIVQGVFGQDQAFAVGGQRQVVGGHLADQADLHGAPGLFGRQVFLQGLLAEAAHPAEQVELVGADGEIGAVLVNGFGSAGPGEVGRNAPAAPFADGVDLRQEVGTANPVLSL